MRRFPLIFILLIAAALAGCKRAQENKDYVFVAAQQVTLRDRVADVYNRVGIVKNGSRLEVLQRSKNKKWVQVKAEDGKIGWVELRSLAEGDVSDDFEKLATANKNAPVQGYALLKTDVRLRTAPDRDAESLYRIDIPEKDAPQLQGNATPPKDVRVELLKRMVKEKKLPPGQVPPPPPPGKKPTGPAMESWWLVRAPNGRVGWVLGRSLDVEVPDDIALYSEGQLIIASFELNQVPSSATDPSPKKQYLVLLSEPRLSPDFDFDQVRVFTWNPRGQRYETAFRDHVKGSLPVLVGKADFGKEGTLPVFTFTALLANGTQEVRKYKMNGVMVRRADQAAKSAPASARRSVHKRRHY